MNKETITLSGQERRRLTVLNQVENGALTVAEATRQLGISPRQFRRISAAFRRHGAAALAHGNRGRQPAGTLPAEIRARVLAMADSPEFADCNDTHLTELLKEREGIQVSRSTVRRWLREAGHPAVSAPYAKRSRKKI